MIERKRKRVVYRDIGSFDDNPRSPTYGEFVVPDDLLTIQEPAEEMDINLIIKRSIERGVQPQWLNSATPRYGDFSEVPSLAEAKELIIRAEESFMQLPANARLELGNDFTRLQGAPREFFERHGLVEPKVELDSPTGESATGGAGGDKPPRKTLKKATSDHSDQD